jgi:hypothetical protein
VAPVAGSDNENAGAAVPSASMVDSMAMPARVAFVKLKPGKATAHGT